jgi:hypothetical protein
MQYGLSPVSSWSSQTSPSAGPIAENNFDVDIINLLPDTDYDYRAVMVVGGTPYYGNTLTVRTAAITPVLPSVTTFPVTSLTQTTATGSGNVTSAGTAAVTERGIVWGLAINPTTSNNKAQSGIGTGAFTAPITGLAPNTTYYVRAYAISAVGTAYGSNLTFTTLGAVEIYYDRIDDGKVLLGANNLAFGDGKVLSITFSYEIVADCGTFDVQTSVYGLTSIGISLDDGVTWNDFDEVSAVCPGIESNEYDSQFKIGTYTINNK